jgi:hypothetical protein
MDIDALKCERRRLAHVPTTICNSGMHVEHADNHSASAPFALRTNESAFLDFELFEARRGQRQVLHVHAGSVHRRDATVANIDELIDERSSLAAT